MQMKIPGIFVCVSTLYLTLNCSSKPSTEITPKAQVVFEPVTDPVRELCTDDSSHRTDYFNVPLVRFVGSTMELNGRPSSDRELLDWAQKRYPKMAEQALWVQVEPDDRAIAESALLPVVKSFPQLHVRQVDLGFTCLTQPKNK